IFLQSREEFTEDNCTVYKCKVNIPLSAEGSTYCVTAKGTLYDELMVGAPSEESCIQVPLKQQLSMPYVVILCGVLVSLSLILTICFGCKKLRKSNIKLPKSLVSVIRNLNTDSFLEPKSDAKYISVISLMPGQSVLPANDGVTLLEVEPQEETASPKNSSEEASSASSPEAPAKAEEMSVQESTEEVSSDDEQNRKVKESYFISDGSQVDMCNDSSVPEVSAPEIEQTAIPSTCLKFSGYDKPHVPLDMLIDVGEEQPVIAYRPTE
ncbi:INGR1 protein, partial [Atlantisia rogersi]|nr:INGR1 protein [Atlantisia rogersi]